MQFLLGILTHLLGGGLQNMQHPLVSAIAQLFQGPQMGVGAKPGAAPGMHYPGGGHPVMGGGMGVGAKPAAPSYGTGLLAGPPGSATGHPGGIMRK